MLLSGGGSSGGVPSSVSQAPTPVASGAVTPSRKTRGVKLKLLCIRRNIYVSFAQLIVHHHTNIKGVEGGHFI